MSSHSVRGRLDSLDGLRALAVLAVIGVHTRVLPGGYIGVDVFFVLSGFLITSILLAEHGASGGISLWRFYARRALRLLPALYVLLAVFTLYALVRHTPDHSTLTALPAVLFYVGNWVQVANGVDALGLWGHTWSLSVEEQFYFIWPLILIALRFSWRRAAALGVCIVVVSPILRELLMTHGAPEGRMRGTDVFLDGLMMGCLLAVVLARPSTATGPSPATGPPPTGSAEVGASVEVETSAEVATSAEVGASRAIGSSGRWVWMPAAAFLLWHLDFRRGLGALDVSAVSFAAMVLIAVMVTCPTHWLGSALAWRPLASIGRISYGLYLWHLPITLALNGHIANPWLLTIAVTTVTMAAAAASWMLVERRALRFKRRFEAPRPHLGTQVDVDPSSGGVLLAE